MKANLILRNVPVQDVVVSGGGLVGSTMMASLQLLRQRLGEQSQQKSIALKHLTMLDAGQRPSYDAQNPLHQLRTCSISPVSSKILENAGSWDRLTTKHAFYRMSIRHEHANSPVKGKTSSPLLDFVDLNTPVGFICFNTEMHASMVSVVEEKATADDQILFNTKLSDLKLASKDDIDGDLGSANVGTEQTHFKLMLGCEGRASNLRDLLGSPVLQHDYSQTAFVCTVRLQKPNDGNVSSFQNFFSDGKIIAMLPCSEETSNIVFSTTAAHAAELLQMSHEELLAELNRRLYDFAPDDIPKIIEVPHSGDKRVQGSFPLRLTVATKPYGPRAICIGDAAHGIHPFAGQGLNLGIYDVCALVDVLESAVMNGSDIGNSLLVGEQFSSEMLAHTFPIIAGMEGIKLLCHNTPGLATFGMNVLHNLPFISSIVKDAMLYAGSGATFAQRHPKCFLLQN